MKEITRRRENYDGVKINRILFWREMSTADWALKLFLLCLLLWSILVVSRKKLAASSSRSVESSAVWIFPGSSFPCSNIFVFFLFLQYRRNLNAILVSAITLRLEFRPG
jgi:hypothetical protein